jgi:transposase InsO family protein
MPKKEKADLSLRKEFVQLAQQEGSNIRLLCRRYGISSRTGYKWLNRYREKGEAGLVDQSRRPKHSPRRTSCEMEQQVLQKRDETGWGGRKIARVLHDEGYRNAPHANTITDILRRNGKLSQAEQRKHHAWQRFERDTPNALWQMDFKGHFPTLHGRCHPFTVLDDHSRFCLGLQACADETMETTQGCLILIFRRYGLPVAVLCDNGGPWGPGHPRVELTHLTVWLIRLGIQILHGWPAHPQTQGKDERFHRTLKAEVLNRNTFASLEDCQRGFDAFRDRYNLVRPHEALGLDTPAAHYQPSPVPFPEVLPAVEYDSGQIIRKVQYGGVIYFKNREFRVGKALRGQSVRLAPSQQEDVFDVFFAQIKVDQIKLAAPLP